jgi:hypothetical protein
MNGNITKEGIQLDLEWMTPEWKDAFLYATKPMPPHTRFWRNPVDSETRQGAEVRRHVQERANEKRKSRSGLHGSAMRDDLALGNDALKEEHTIAVDMHLL